MADQDKKSWIDSLAQRSTGLPGQDTPPPAKGTQDKNLWHYAGLGFQFAATLLLFAFMGYELDKWLGWTPWGMVSLTMIALIGNFYMLIKEQLAEAGTSKKKKP